MAGFVVWLLLAPVAVTAGDPVPFSARDGEGLARSAAAAWARDAELVYVENDEGVSDLGRAGRWGYLFWSDAREEARAYSVRDGKIRTATDFEFDFPAPPLDSDWIDSGRALSAANKDAGGNYLEKHDGKLRAMLLVRGLLHTDDPDATTWAVVYDSETASGLWVVVDAQTGEVVKKWRG